MVERLGKPRGDAGRRGMSARPLREDHTVSGSAVPPTYATFDVPAIPTRPRIDLFLRAPESGTRRRLTVHEPMAAFGLIDELDFLTRRAVDQNPFFAPQFLVPAMPRLDDRRVQLMLVRDEAGARSRLRVLLPFTVEKPGLFGGAPVIRAFAHPFGRLGTPLLDNDDPAGTLADLFVGLAKPELDLPDVLVLPEVRLDGPAAGWIQGVAAARGLASLTTNVFERAVLSRARPPVTAAKHRRELARLRRVLHRLGGPVRARTAADPEAVRLAFEEFLVLEASGWKGRERSALVMDRFRSAFAREAVNLMAEKERARIVELRAGGRLAASLVFFVVGGEAVLWKIAYDEAFAAASPGFQVVDEATRHILADPGIVRVDSCAMPDSLVVNRLWPERTSVGTLVVSLRPGGDERVAQVARALQTSTRSRNAVRLMRERLAGLFGR
jgi:hypothetical protein